MGDEEIGNQGGPLSRINPLIPLGNFVASVAALEASELGFEEVWLLGEVGIGGEEKVYPGGEGGIEFDASALLHLMPEGGREVDRADLVAFGFHPNRLSGVEVAEGVMENAVKTFLAGLGLVGFAA